ncbi:serine/threonine protein kinase [Streptomyces cellostaticus]|uniref:non-specific serine/threonine protein kinase n=2 Tax=Streptomyces cellostaticus TaxID=67285 RepID=A0A101NIJ7_9ACTN|nr:serine/threonine protein kinase [Streptomyces cellostaticus]
MGRVWRAVDEILDRLVAVKEIRIVGQAAEDSRTHRERTLREGRATARIDHPNVVRVYDVVDEGERLWIVMELVPGRSLERIMTEEGPLSPRETAHIGLGLAAALGQVHAGGVLHRDIKPGNVLVEGGAVGAGGAGRVVLTDFGIAAIQDAKALTMVGMLVGSPDYMAPERISGRRQGPPSDLWSLGATLCAALAGRSPFSRDTTLATLHAVLYENPELPPTAGPLHSLLAALLTKEPSSRPALAEVERALRQVAYPSPTPTVLSGEGATAGPGQGGSVGADSAGQGRGEPGEAQAGRGPSGRPSQGASDGGGRVPVAFGPVPVGDRSAPVGDGPVLAGGSPAPDGGGPALTRAGAVAGRRAVTSSGTAAPVSSGGPGRTALLAALGVVAVAVVAAVLLATSGGGAGPEGARTGTGTASSSAAASPAVEGTSRPRTPPADARTEAGGFAWVPPQGWRRDVKTAAEVHYTSPDGRQELVGKSSLARGDLMDTWRRSEQDARQGRDYVKIRLAQTTFQGHPAVVWEYTFTLKGTPWHARLLGFDAGGKSYQINTWYQPETEPRALKTYSTVKETFTVL